MLEMWFCRDISENISPYRMLRSKYVKHINNGKQRLSNMKYLVKQAIRAAGIVNRYYLVVQNCSLMTAMDLYLGVMHFFVFP